MKHKKTMKEKIIKFQKSPLRFKKYRATIKNKNGIKHIDFGDNRYQQYKDSTPLKLYRKLDHNDTKRRHNYFSRHSKIKYKRLALEKEIQKSNGQYNAKILSHQYLW